MFVSKLCLVPFRLPCLCYVSTSFASSFCKQVQMFVNMRPEHGILKHFITTSTTRKHYHGIHYVALWYGIFIWALVNLHVFQSKIAFLCGSRSFSSGSVLLSWNIRHFQNEISQQKKLLWKTQNYIPSKSVDALAKKFKFILIFKHWKTWCICWIYSFYLTFLFVFHIQTSRHLE